MATVTAGNSASVTISGDQTVAISVNHNNSGRFQFVPSNSGSVISDGGTGRTFGPLPTTVTYGPFNVAGTLTIYCDVGTVTYTVNDSYFPNSVKIGQGSAATLGSTAPFAWVSARANSSGGASTTPQELLRLSWQEGVQDISTGEGCAINFAASLVTDNDTFYPIASIATYKTNTSDTFRTSDLTFSVSNDGTAAPTEYMRLDSAGRLGIGTNNPAARLEVYQAANNLIRIGSAAAASAGVSIAANGNTYGTTSFEIYQDSSSVGVINTVAAQPIRFGTTNTERVRITATGNVHTPAGTTSMTDGFFYIPGAAGAPSGTPTSISGTFPMYYDSTNNRFYVYNGGWKSVVLA